MLLWLEDMKGWALSSSSAGPTKSTPLQNSDLAELETLILLAQQLIMKTGHLERAAGSEQSIFGEFCKFVKLGAFILQQVCVTYLPKQH